MFTWIIDASVSCDDLQLWLWNSLPRVDTSGCIWLWLNTYPQKKLENTRSDQINHMCTQWTKLKEPQTVISNQNKSLMSSTLEESSIRLSPFTKTIIIVGYGYFKNTNYVMTTALSLLIHFLRFGWKRRKSTEQDSSNVVSCSYVYYNKLCMEIGWVDCISVSVFVLIRLTTTATIQMAALLQWIISIRDSTIVYSEFRAINLEYLEIC